MEIKASQVGCFQITGCWICYCLFKTFVKKFMEKLSFFSSNFKNLFQDVVYHRKLGCLTLWYWNGGPRLKVEKFVRFWNCFLRNKKMLVFWIFMNQIFWKWFLISHKITYMGLLLLKLRAVELESRTEADFWFQIGVYSRKNCPRQGSGQLPPANS